MRTDDIIELLNCAEINCDNAKRVPQLIGLVKIQIGEAIKLIEERDEKEPSHE